jgi:hypothetical protein
VGFRWVQASRDGGKGSAINGIFGLMKDKKFTIFSLCEDECGTVKNYPGPIGDYFPIGQLDLMAFYF